MNKKSAIKMVDKIDKIIEQHKDVYLLSDTYYRIVELLFSYDEAKKSLYTQRGWFERNGRTVYCSIKKG